MNNKKQEVQRFVNGVNQIVNKSQQARYNSDDQVSLLGSSINSKSVPALTSSQMINTPQPGSYNSVINQMAQGYQSNSYSNGYNVDVASRAAQMRENEAQNQANNVRQYVSSYTPDASASNIQQAAQNLNMQYVQQNMQYSGQNQYSDSVEQNIKNKQLESARQNMNTSFS